MTKRVVYSTKAKKDLKRYANDYKKLAELKYVLDILAEGKDLPKEYRPHMLHGNYKNHMECHIEGDFLLVWYDQTRDLIEVVRIGTHSQIFKM